MHNITMTGACTKQHLFSMTLAALHLLTEAMSVLADNASSHLPTRDKLAVLCREACLKGEGFWDPFKPVKDEENNKALKLLPGILK